MAEPLPPPFDFTQYWTESGLIRCSGFGNPDEIEGTAWIEGAYHPETHWCPGGKPALRPSPVVPKLNGRVLDLGPLPEGTEIRIRTPEGEIVEGVLDPEGVTFDDPGRYLFEATPPAPWHRIVSFVIEVE